ncbi:MAG: hypothetical protein IKF52_01680, partial [Clostridia bacterium]|nr:hypothetical protein [Clostridia bacterium]
MKKRSKFIVFFIVVIILAGIQVSNKMNNVVADDNNNDEIPSKYNIRDYIDLTVKNQYQNDLCIPTSNSTAIESYVKMRKLKGELNFITENPVFSIIAARQIGSSYIYVIPIENTEEVISEFYNGEITTEDELLRQQKVGDMDLDFELKKIQSKYQLIREDGRIGSLYSLGEINKS